MFFLDMDLKSDTLFTIFIRILWNSVYMKPTKVRGKITE